MEWKASDDHLYEEAVYRDVLKLRIWWNGDWNVKIGQVYVAGGKVKGTVQTQKLCAIKAAKAFLFGVDSLLTNLAEETAK